MAGLRGAWASLLGKVGWTGVVTLAITTGMVTFLLTTVRFSIGWRIALLPVMYAAWYVTARDSHRRRVDKDRAMGLLDRLEDGGKLTEDEAEDLRRTIRRGD